jgi:hypothetical protein
MLKISISHVTIDIMACYYGISIYARNYSISKLFGSLFFLLFDVFSNNSRLEICAP